MTLHFHWLQAHAHFNRAMTLVLGVIGVSLLFGALRILDGAVSGGLVASQPASPVASSTAASGAFDASLVIGSEPPGAGPRVQKVDEPVVEVPEAAAEAISL